MDKIYVICETHFEYNDEVYTASGSGDPIVFYKDLETARAACGKKNLERLLLEKDPGGYREELRDYGYDIDEVLTDFGIHFLESRGMELDDIDELSCDIRDFLLTKCTEEERLKFTTEGLQFSFFSVYEVEQG